MTQRKTVDIQAFLDRLGAEAELYDTMLVLSRRQAEMLAVEDGGTAMLEAVSAKQGTMQRIEAIERKIRPIKEGWNGLKERLDPAQRAEAEERMRRLRDAIKELIDLESKWHEAVMSQHENAGAELKRLDQVRKTGAAYRVGGLAGGARYVDRNE